MTSMGHYLFRLLACIIALLAGIALFNWFINPYGYFNAPRLKGINEKTLGFNHRLRLAKALAIDKIRPATVIVGNSRAEAGYDPEHSGFTAPPVYNLAMGGGGMDETRRYLLEALALGEVRHIVIALDFTMFDATSWNQGNPYQANLLSDETGTIGSPTWGWHRLGRTILSGDALSDSWWSLMHQSKPVAVYLPSGLRDDESDLAQVAREGGSRSSSKRVEASFLASTLKNTETEIFRRGYRNTFTQLGMIAALTADRDIRLTLLINPIHARHSYLFESAGLWPTYEQWKRDVVALTLKGAELLDFSAVSPCTAEPLPAAGDTTTAMRWYREIAHFRRALGNEVLDRALLGRKSIPCGDFGQRLDAFSIETALKSQRQALVAWMATHGDDVADIDARARQFGRR